MKKVVIIFIMLSMALVSCGKKDVEKTDLDTKAPVENTENKEVANVEEKPPVDDTWVTEEKVNWTMMEIFKKWKPATCTFKITWEDGSIYDSIMYIDWKVLRYVMKWEIEWQKLENNVLLKDWYSYSWSNMAPGWFKMKEDLNEETKEEWNEMEAKEMNETYEFDCKSWVDAAMFELPADIKFQEFDMAKIPNMPNWN